MTKVLIVEDEPILRKGIVTLIDWESLQCEVVGECPNGIIAVNYLKQNSVDIVISDIKMPGMDGLELSAYIQKNYPKTSVVLLTAYSEFEYAKAAISYGVVDYVLKKDFVQTLPRSIERIVAEKSKSIVTSIDSVSPASINLNDLVFSRILDGTISQKEEISSFLSQYSITLDSYFVLILEVLGLPSSFTEKKAKEEIGRILNIFSTAFHEDSHFHQILSRHEIYLIVNGNWDNPANATRKIVKICNDISDMLTEYTEYSVCIGISSLHTDMLQLKTAGEEAVIAGSRVFGPKQVQAYSLLSDKSPSQEKLDVNSVSRNLLQEINPFDENKFSDYLHTLFMVPLKNSSIDKMKIDAAYLVSLSCDFLTNLGVDSKTKNKLNLETTKNIMEKYTPKGIEYELAEFYRQLAKLAGATDSGSHRLIQQVNHFIKENYALPIKLNEIADFLHVNSSYLSRLYKKETGEPLITYLNKYRVKKAKELLQSGNYLVSEVGEMVGIDNPSYFTKVFTKYEGVSPNQI